MQHTKVVTHQPKMKSWLISCLCQESKYSTLKVLNNAMYDTLVKYSFWIEDDIKVIGVTHCSGNYNKIIIWTKLETFEFFMSAKKFRSSVVSHKKTKIYNNKQKWKLKVFFPQNTNMSFLNFFFLKKASNNYISSCSGILNIFLIELFFLFFNIIKRQ